MNPILSFIIILIGFYGIATSKHIVKSIICLNIIQAGTILFFLNLGYSREGDLPIYFEGIKDIVDPIPQSLMITTIIIGSTISATALILSIKIFHHYGSLYWDKIFEKEK